MPRRSLRWAGGQGWAGVWGERGRRKGNEGAGAGRERAGERGRGGGKKGWA